jgi:hypothetical protein
MPQRTYANLETKAKDIKKSRLDMLKKSGISLKWLMDGEGPMEAPRDAQRANGEEDRTQPEQALTESPTSIVGPPTRSEGDYREMVGERNAFERAHATLARETGAAVKEAVAAT